MEFDRCLVGKRIKKYRKRQGLSQEALAEKMDCSPTHISYIENGNRSLSLESFIAIANILHVSADELLIDCLECTVKISNHEFSNMIQDCNDYEKRILLDIAGATKQSLRNNRSYLAKSSNKV